MLRKNPSGHYPQVSPDAFVDPTAILCGNVIVEANVFIGPYAVLRADELDEQGEILPIHVKRDSNIQDGVVIHSKDGAAVTIGERTSIAHRSIVHGPCEIGDDVFVGFNSVIFRSHVGNHCIIRHNSVVDGVDLPESCHVPPVTKLCSDEDFSAMSQVTADAKTFSESVVEANHRLVRKYKKLANEL